MLCIFQSKTRATTAHQDNEHLISIYKARNPCDEQIASLAHREATNLVSKQFYLLATTPDCAVSLRLSLRIRCQKSRRQTSNILRSRCRAAVQPIHSLLSKDTQTTVGSTTAAPPHHWRRCIALTTVLGELGDVYHHTEIKMSRRSMPGAAPRTRLHQRCPARRTSLQSRSCRC